MTEISMSPPGFDSAILARRAGRVFSASRLFYVAGVVGRENLTNHRVHTSLEGAGVSGQSVLVNHGQQQVRFPAFAGVNAVSPGEALGRPVARIVVEEPARSFLHAALARALEVLSLQGERETVACGKREARRPDFEVDFVNLAGFQLLRLVVRMPGLPFGRALRVELALRDAQPALRDRRLGLDRTQERDFPAVR